MPVACRAARTMASATTCAASAPTRLTSAEAGLRVRREREDDVAVAHRVARVNGAGEAVVRHLRDLRRLRLRERRVRGDDAERGVFAEPRRLPERA